MDESNNRVGEIKVRAPSLRYRINAAFDSWVNAHQDSWYMTPALLIGVAFSLDNPEDNLFTRTKEKIAKIHYVPFSGGRAKLYHDGLAADRLSNHTTGYAWHSFCEAASRWPPFSRKG